MAKVRLLQGKPLMVGGKVALSDDCCCNPPVTGGCCLPEDCSCVIRTHAQCNALGGRYRGDFTGCVPNQCCPTITLKCEQIGCLADKCGFPEFEGFESDPSKYYLTKTQVYTCGPSSTNCTITDTWTPNYVDCTGGLQCDFSQVDGCTLFTCLCTFMPPTPTSATHSQWIGTCLLPNDISLTVDLSSEFTDIALETIVYGMLPTYTDVFTTGTCSAYAGYSGVRCHSRFEVNRFQYKFTFTEATCNFTIFWKQKSTPHTPDIVNEHCDLVAGDPTYEDFLEDISIGQTESSVYEIVEPDLDNTTVEVSDITTSCD